MNRVTIFQIIIINNSWILYIHKTVEINLKTIRIMCYSPKTKCTLLHNESVNDTQHHHGSWISSWITSAKQRTTNKMNIQEYTETWITFALNLLWRRPGVSWIQISRLNNTILKYIILTWFSFSYKRILVHLLAQTLFRTKTKKKGKKAKRKKECCKTKSSI